MGLSDGWRWLGTTTGLVAAASLGAGEVNAAEPTGATLVAIVTAEPSASLTRKVRAELQGLGLDVIVLRPPAEGSSQRAPLEQAARSVGAIAAIRLVVSSEGKVEIWVADRVTGKALVRELDAPTSTGGGSDASVAVGAVELLRASLMELHAPDPPRGEVPATPAVTSLALPDTRPTRLTQPWIPRLGIAVSAGAELGVAGVGPSFAAGVDVGVRVAGGLVLRVAGRGSPGASRLHTASGAIDVQWQQASAMASYELADAAAPWIPSLAVGVGATHVTASGTASSPYMGTSEDGWFTTPLAGAGLAWTLARGLRLRVEALAGWAIPSADIHTPTGTPARWGAPVLLPSLSLEVLWAP